MNRELPHLGDAGREQRLEPLSAYMVQLAWRLERVRITCGSWERVVGPSVTRATAGNSKVGILLDPPYATSGDLYATTNCGGEAVATKVADWCESAPADLRIVLCGYDDEHDRLLEHGWRKVEGKAGGEVLDTPCAATTAVVSGCGSHPPASATSTTPCSAMRHDRLLCVPRSCGRIADLAWVSSLWRLLRRAVGRRAGAEVGPMTCTAATIWPEIGPHGVRLACCLPVGHDGEHGAGEVEYLEETA